MLRLDRQRTLITHQCPLSLLYLFFLPQTCEYEKRKIEFVCVQRTNSVGIIIRMAFRARKVFGTFEKRAPGRAKEWHLRPEVYNPGLPIHNKILLNSLRCCRYKSGQSLCYIQIVGCAIHLWSDFAISTRKSRGRLSWFADQSEAGADV